MIFSIDDASRRDRVALIDGRDGKSYTYRHLSANVSRRRGELEAASKSLLFLFCRNDPQSVAWYLAAIEAGHAVALLKDDLEPGFRADLIAVYRPEWVVSSTPPESGEYESSSEGSLWKRRRPQDAPLHSDLALLLSTSGSTGSPKFVRLTRRNIESNATAICGALEITPDDLPVAHLPIHYSYGLSVLNSHLEVGAATLLTDTALVTPAFWEAIRGFRANSFPGVPYTYQMLRRLGLENLNVPTLRKLTQAGGKLDEASVAFFHERMSLRGGGLWVMYGQTEATARISVLHAGETGAKPGSVGKAIPGGALEIASPGKVPSAAADDEGELIYTGPNVMLGYATARADLAKGDELHGRLHTGDRARLDEDGFLSILGRAGRDAKIFGLRVNLDELEALVRAYGPAAAVSGGDRVVVFCEFGSETSRGEALSALCAKLRIHRSAFEFRDVGELPTKDNGKIDYEELSARV